LPDFKEYRVTWAEAQRRRRIELGAQSKSPSPQGGFVAVG
jgi:predicted phage gp36 major capsid-like protein